MSKALESRMERIETKLEHFEAQVDRLVDKQEAVDGRIAGMDRKLDKLIFELSAYNDRLNKVEKTVNEDIVPWKHFVHKLIAILSVIGTTVGVLKFVL